MRNEFHPLLTRISSVENQFTEIDREIAKFIQAHLEDIPTYTANDIAAKTYISKASLTRFCKKIGFDGFKELKYFSATIIENETKMALFQSNSYFQSIYDQYLHIINSYQLMLNDQVIKNVVDAMKNADLIYIIGIGNSGFVAMDFANRLFRFGFKCFALNDESFIKMHASVAKSNDLFILISASGETPIIVETLKVLHNSGIHNLLISNYSISSASKYAQHTILFPSKYAQQSNFFISDLIAPTLLLDIIIAYLLSDASTQYLKTYQKTLDLVEYYEPSSDQEEH